MSRWRENYKPIKKGRLIMKKFFELSTKILYSMIICLTLVLVGMVISKNVAAAQEVTLDEGMIKNILCPSNTTTTVKIDNKTYTIYWAHKYVGVNEGTGTVNIVPFSYFLKSEFFNTDGTAKDFSKVMSKDDIYTFDNEEFQLLVWDEEGKQWRKDQLYDTKKQAWVTVKWDDESNDYIPVE
jgi:hypothetical protein